MDLPKTFDEFVDARKQGFIRAKEFKDNGGKLAGCLCSYTPQELLDAAGVATVGLCGNSSENNLFYGFCSQAQSRFEIILQIVSQAWHYVTVRRYTYSVALAAKAA